MTEHVVRDSAIPWIISITNLGTRLRVGIWDHEREFQPITVNLILRAASDTAPQTLAACLDYSALIKWITDEWPQQAHIPLLGTRVQELVAYVFGYDPRIEWVDAALSKPKACDEAHAVGVRLAVSRGDYDVWCSAR